jgi:hypothetical protein
MRLAKLPKLSEWAVSYQLTNSRSGGGGGEGVVGDNESVDV